MDRIVAATLVAVLLGIAGFHVYWAFGGTLGARVAIPEVGGRPAFEPGRAGTLVVAGLLLAAAAIVAMKALAIPPDGLGAWIVGAGAWVLTAVFLLRTVGDFNRFGLFRAARDTAFTAYDTWLFTPLCLLLAIGCFVVARGR